MARTVVKIRVKQGRQPIDKRTVALDTDDTDAVLATLRAVLGEYGIDVGPTHKIEIYKPSGEFVREVSAA
jgi:hypothetical protein